VQFFKTSEKTGNLMTF